jgi:nicotinate-nucleotide adenylyltransferase
MGGTFDPIHHGHLVAASEVQAWFGLDEVVFVPTGAPWQKADRQVTAAEDRYLMTVIATASNPRFWVSRVDIDRGGPTYTIDTLRDLREQIPDAELYFITGADALADIFTWRDADELFGMARFVGCTRPGFVMDPETLGKIPSGSRSWRCRRWRSAPATYADVPCEVSPCGTSCPMAWSSTSPSTSCTRACRLPNQP